MYLKYTIITIISALMFVVPFFMTLYRLRNRIDFSLAKVRLLFNYSLMYQIGVGFVFYLVFLIFGGDIFRDGLRTAWFEMLSMATVWFYVIGLFYYIPALILLNLIIVLIKWIRKDKPPLV